MTRTLIHNARVVTAHEVLGNAAVWIDNDRIVRIEKGPVSLPPDWNIVDAKQACLVPAWVDLHIHGMGGFGPEQGTAQSLIGLSTCLAKQGVGAFCPTLYGAKPAKMIELLQKLTPALGQEPGATIIGFHLEGPFISPQKPGVMRPEDMAPADLHSFEQMYEAAQGKIAIVTLAPELPGIDPIIDFCVQHHIVVQAGHTNATYEQMQAAVDKGVRRVTHLGNAMSGLHQRAPGVLGAALVNKQISCEVIADGKHVHPALLALLHRTKLISQITAVTDALLPTQQAHEPFIANGEEVILREGVWKRKTDEVTAGSALTMHGAFKQLLQIGYTLTEAACCTSTNAAQVVGLSANLQAGAQANMVLLSDNHDILQIWLRGKAV